jgi:monoamine oxidase
MSRTSRREFLKILSVSTAGIAASSTSTVFAQQRKPKTCVIIGAGLAGLSAAYKLKTAGWEVTVLDGRARIGGRVFSHTFKDTNLRTRCRVGG